MMHCTTLSGSFLQALQKKIQEVRKPAAPRTPSAAAAPRAVGAQIDPNSITGRIVRYWTAFVDKVGGNQVFALSLVVLGSWLVRKYSSVLFATSGYVYCAALHLCCSLPIVCQSRICTDCMCLDRSVLGHQKADGIQMFQQMQL
jgi:hypothetical protein